MREGKVNRLPGYVMGFCLLTSFFSMSSDRCLGYVLPSSQLISYMVKNFSEFKTLVITQTTWQKGERNGEGWESYQERIWMESPGLFRSEVLDLPKGRLMEPDTSFRSLLMANNDTWVVELLTRMGINLNAAGLTRVEETVAYRIGGKDPDAPKIVIEKKRFLPLVLTYSFPGNNGTATITVLFSDYRKIDKGWYPFEITYFDPRGFRENCMIDTLQANVPIDPAIFAGADVSYGPAQNLEQGEIFQKEKNSETKGDSRVDRLRVTSPPQP
jgi:hypothetical protein